MLIQCQTQEGYDLLARCDFTIPLGDLKIDVDEDYLSPEVIVEFKALEGIS